MRCSGGGLLVPRLGLCRWLASTRLDVAALRQSIARHVLQQHGRQRLWLLLDETTQGHNTVADADGARLRVLTIRLAYRRRSVPLVWACHRSGEQAAPYPELIAQLCQEMLGWIRAQNVARQGEPIDRVGRAILHPKSFPQLLPVMR